MIDAQGQRYRIDSSDVNDYLRDASGPFTTKDFRTCFATLKALQNLRRRTGGTQREIKSELTAAICAAAQRLGNTPAICRKCYIHPEALAAFRRRPACEIERCRASRGAACAVAAAQH